ncbi:SHOCT domain-containing protein [Filobacillus milosensis]|uniref:SHOCT domain-containing protein n=1 Tax=Filobacillus milosensis TaxID=94137 RepID=A0A4Y8IGF0_9BACI|nr:SHOCT domain-containing protein [Filobacillus milosensis]TFB14111.1 SHOCT domain-containing protein [Filobacillus milosensis]
MMWDDCNIMEGPMMIGGGLMMLLFWALIIGLGIYLFKNISKNNNSKPSNSAVNILNERFARGEINKEEYRERLNALSEQN